ncbi:MAG: SgcJ/EcaC family oxidoreductase [Vicinamibacterales bacterium]
MSANSPFLDTPAIDDEELRVRRAQEGDRESLEWLVRRHSPWIYNIALRVLCHPEDAQDASQEILVKVITRLSTFEGRSSFRTWLYRIAFNHLLTMERLRRERWTFEAYGRVLEELPEGELVDSAGPAADVQVWLEEAKIGCTTGLLLCLDREQRLIYILGDIFGVSDRLGAELLELSRDNFRQKLSRARRDLQSFAQGKCGLVNPANSCRCTRKTKAFIDAGYVNPQNLLFVRDHVQAVREVAPAVYDDLEEADRQYAELHRAHPFQVPPDFVARLRALLGILLIALCVQACRAPAQSGRATALDQQAPQLAAADEAAVRGALDAYFDAAISGDPSRWAALYANDAVMMPPSSATVEGRAAIETWLKALPVVITEADGNPVEVIGTGDLAYVRGTYAIGMKLPGVTDPVLQEGKLLQIYRRQQNGTWLLARDIWNANASPENQ